MCVHRRALSSSSSSPTGTTTPPDTGQPASHTPPPTVDESVGDDAAKVGKKVQLKRQREVERRRQHIAHVEDLQETLSKQRSVVSINKDTQPDHVILFQYHNPLRIRAVTAIITFQTLFFSGVSVVSHLSPNVIPWYWGGGGLAFTLVCMVPMIYVYAKRMTCELTLVERKQKVRVTTFNALGMPRNFVVPVHEVGKGDIDPKNTTKGQFNMFKVSGRAGYFLMDKRGVISNKPALFRVIGYAFLEEEEAAQRKLTI